MPVGVRKKTAFLDLLLDIAEESKNLKDRDIRDEVDTFMFEVSYTFECVDCFNIKKAIKIYVKYFSHF